MVESQRRPFFLVAIATFGVVVATVGMVNYVVDPYRIFHEWVIAGVTASKPAAGRRGQVIKPILVGRAGAATLVIGASREDVGIDPHHPGWPVGRRPVFNFGVPGSRPYAQLRYLQHAAQFRAPSLIVMSVDYLSFLEAVEEHVPFAASDVDDGLRVEVDGSPNANYRWKRFHDYYSSLFSIDALAHSIETLLGQTGYESIDSQGFSSGAERFLSEIAAKGQYSVVRDVVRAQADQIARLVAPPAGPATFRRQLAVLDRVFDLAEERQAALKLFIPPSHAYELENLWTHGLWGDFERWKLELTIAVELANETHALPTPVTLLDFSGYHPIATESVPAPGDRSTVMRWYWEPIHYRKELGDRIVDDLFASDAPSLGVELRRGSICSHLLKVRDDRGRYSKRPDPRRSELFKVGSGKDSEAPAWGGTVGGECEESPPPARSDRAAGGPAATRAPER